MVSAFPAAIPIPVSRTEKRSSAAPSPTSSTLTVSTTSPRSVNLIALPSRLMSTWRSRTGSPIRRLGTSGRASASSSRPFWWARSATVLSADSISASSANSMVSRSSRPASIFEKSRMSLMTDSSVSAEARAVAR